MNTRITSHGIMVAIDRLERAVRSRLPNPAAEIETTLTRDVELVFDPKSVRERSKVQPAPKSSQQAANSDPPQSQHTFAHLLDSKETQNVDWRQLVKEGKLAPEDAWAFSTARIERAWNQNWNKPMVTKRKPPV